MYDCAAMLHISGDTNNRSLSIRYWGTTKMGDGLFSESLPKFSPDFKKWIEVSGEAAGHRVRKNCRNRNAAHRLAWLTEGIRSYVLLHYDQFAHLDHDAPIFRVEA